MKRRRDKKAGMSVSADKIGHSSFRSTLLAFARKQLNLMLSEVCQLKQADRDFSSDEKLTATVLTKIAAGEIKSVHISQEEAVKYLKLISSCECNKQNYLLRPNSKAKDEDEEAPNPYFNSPF
ncbi:hypothetical protein COTS27_00812 [Spirochaetota bacterium]|nr:hypothetical protein COTS27_00812 [Spirochaetota bacterium]